MSYPRDAQKAKQAQTRMSLATALYSRDLHPPAHYVHVCVHLVPVAQQITC